MKKNNSFEPPYLPEEQFKTFFKQSTGFVGAIVAGMPVITGYLEIVPPPNSGKAISLLAMALSATIFLSLFWFRDRLDSMRAMKISWTSIVSGTIILVVYLQLISRGIPASPFAIEVAKTIAYFAGFVALLGGFSGVFVCGFVRSRGRSHLLNELLHQLEPKQWNDLRDYARTLVTLNGEIKSSEIQPTSKHALERSHAHILADYKRTLSRLEAGMLEIRGPAMDELYQYFMDGIQKKFSAISQDDLNYWSNKQLSGRYFLSNKKLITEKRKIIERIFLINREKTLTEEAVSALREQVNIGVRVSIAYMDDVSDIAKLSELDFGLFDTFAVSSWKFGENKDRLFQVMTSKRDIEHYTGLFQQVKRRCVVIPDKEAHEAGMDRVFETCEEINRWAKSAVSTECSRKKTKIHAIKTPSK